MDKRRLLSTFYVIIPPSLFKKKRKKCREGINHLHLEITPPTLATTEARSTPIQSKHFDQND